MRRSKKTNTLVLVSKHTITKTKVYDDKKIADQYHYTGMGMSGDQSLSFAQNKTLAESNTNGVDVHFFEVFKEGEYIYMGIVKLAGAPYESYQEDENRIRRKVWIFPLALVEETNPSTIIDKEILVENYDDQKRIAKTLDINELLNRAIKSASFASYRKTITNTYIRNPYIAEYTKRRAKGICELCKLPAPFNDRQGDPYLESHHIKWLSKHGPDEIENTVALCSNCHKRMHIRDDKVDVEYLISLR